MKASAHSQRVRLSRMAKRAGGPVVRARQCRICLAAETWDAKTERSSLDRGVCADRRACEARQAPLW